MKAHQRLFATLLLLLAGGLRLYGISALGTQADEGVHIAAAAQVAEGATLYRDLFENRTPAVEWLLAGIFRLTGPNIVVGRVVAVGAALLTVAGLFAAGRAAAGNAGAGAAAGLLFALAPLPLFWARYTMLEHFATAAAALSVAAALQAQKQASYRWWAFSGLLLGLAVLAKQPAAVLVFVMALFFLLQLRSERRRILGFAAAWAAAGAAVLLFFLGCLVVRGSLPDFWRFVSSAGRPTLPAAESMGVWAQWALRRPVVPLALAGSLLALMRHRAPLLLLLLWPAAEAGLLLLAPQFDFDWGGFSHYALPFIASASLLAGVALLWLWQHRPGHSRTRWTALLLLLAILATAPGWLQDLGHALFQRTYPQATFRAEAEIGHAAALLTGEEQPLLVLGNAVFYHWAGRPPASRFFHLPAYVAGSAVATLAEAELTQALAAPTTGAVVASRMHLEERLTPALARALWQRWSPAAFFSYPYQRDVFLLVPKTKPAAGPALATFGPISLLRVRPQRLDATHLLVQLEWQARQQPAHNFTVFVHVLDAAGNLVAQHDSFPVVGTRPTTSWQTGEILVDRHWIVLPRALDLGSRYQLGVGLYRPENGERLLRENDEDSFIIPLEE